MKLIATLIMINFLLITTNVLANESVNIEVENKCKLKVKKPRKPMAFNKYYSISKYNTEVNTYNKGIIQYSKCVKSLINEINREIDKLESFGNNVARKANALELIEEAKENK